MNILCHRGYWIDPLEKNSWSSLVGALERGFGIETDVRDLDGQLVISHDPPRSGSVRLLSDLLAFYAALPHHPMLALNVKSDGLQTELELLLSAHKVRNYFAFDMSIPDTLGYRKMRMPFAVRMSEFEAENALYADASWVWLDGFESDWFTEATFAKLVGDGKLVAIVSPELHGRSHHKLWRAVKEISDTNGIYLCTDYLDEAMEFF